MRARWRMPPENSCGYCLARAAASGSLGSIGGVALGYTVSQESSNFVARDQDGNARLSATIVGGKFHGGYTTDRMGHITSHSTVRDMIRFAA